MKGISLLVVAAVLIGFVEGGSYAQTVIQRLHEHFNCHVVEVDDALKGQVGVWVSQGKKIPAELLKQFDLVTAHKIFADGVLMPFNASELDESLSVKKGSLATTESLPVEIIAELANKSIQDILLVLDGKVPKIIRAAVASVVYDANPPFEYVVSIFQIELSM